MIHRLRQVGAALGDRAIPVVPDELAATPRTAHLFATLATHDQRHLLAVHRACVAAGLPTAIAMAGLLHDIGKASLSERRVNLLDRSLRVVLRRISPGLLIRWTREPAPTWRLGLHLAERHPALGADRLSALGWQATVVSAVYDHEGDNAAGVLATLRQIDDSAP